MYLKIDFLLKINLLPFIWLWVGVAKCLCCKKNFYVRKSVPTVQNPHMQKEKFEKPQMQTLYPKMQKVYY